MIDEIINNQIPSGIPDAIYEEEYSIVPNYDLSNSPSVNVMLITMATQMEAVGWSRGPDLYATFKFIIDLPIASHSGPFDTVILDYFGLAYKIWNPDHGDSDPSNVNTVGVLVFDGMSQNEIIKELARTMGGQVILWEIVTFSHTPSDPVTDIESPFFGVYTTITITAVNPGSASNDIGGIGNTLGGGTFLGTSKYGGYTLTSPEGLHVSMFNDSNGNFAFTSGFSPEGCELNEAVLVGRDNYMCYSSLHQWIVFPAEYKVYSNRNTRENEVGVSDYHLGKLYVPPELKAGPRTLTSNNGYGWEIPSIRNPIFFAGFMMSTNRAFLTEDVGCATCTNDFFKIGQFVGLDCGVTYMVYNTRYHEAGKIISTAERTIRYSSIMALTEGNSLFNRQHGIPYTSTKSQIYGYTYNMFLTTEHIAFGNLIEDNGSIYMSYRTQTTPCETTLWLKVG